MRAAITHKNRIVFFDRSGISRESIICPIFLSMRKSCHRELRVLDGSIQFQRIGTYILLETGRKIGDVVHNVRKKGAIGV